MKKIIAVLLILSLIPVSGLIGKTENDVGLMAKETEGVKKKSHTFGKVVLWTLAAAAVGAVVYFTVIKKPEYKLKVEVGSGVEGSPAAGEYKYKKGSTVSYDFRKLAGYGSLTVTLDGSPVAFSGTISMDKEHSLQATALEIGNYTSIKFQLNYIYKGYGIVAGYIDVQFRKDDTFIRRIIGDTPGIICPSTFDSSITCAQAVEGRRTTTDQEINTNYINIYQDYMAVRCSLFPETFTPLVCPSFEITILSYTWEQNKSDPGSPQVSNVDSLKIDLVKDLFQVGSPSSPFWIWRKNTRLDFVRPSNPQAAQRVFTVGSL